GAVQRRSRIRRRLADLPQLDGDARGPAPGPAAAADRAGIRQLPLRGARVRQPHRLRVRGPELPGSRRMSARRGAWAWPALVAALVLVAPATASATGT